MTRMKLLRLVVLTLIFGLLSHLLMHALGSRGIASVAIATFIAAAISTTLWVWRYKNASIADGLTVGAIAVMLIAANTLYAHGLAIQPLHLLTTLAISFVAMPACFAAARLINGRR